MTRDQKKEIAVIVFAYLSAFLGLGGAVFYMEPFWAEPEVTLEGREKTEPAVGRLEILGDLLMIKEKEEYGRLRPVMDKRQLAGKNLESETKRVLKGESSVRVSGTRLKAGRTESKRLAVRTGGYRFVEFGAINKAEEPRRNVPFTVPAPPDKTFPPGMGDQEVRRADPAEAKVPPLNSDREVRGGGERVPTGLSENLRLDKNATDKRGSFGNLDRNRLPAPRTGRVRGLSRGGELPSPVFEGASPAGRIAEIPRAAEVQPSAPPPDGLRLEPERTTSEASR
ncbi:MAG: hypothetical protein D6679_12200 [Candidatus Hydrogenedentota bacterium]|nr:MAG: hypothetical protein D6679_12200 [Candidatus Hydrogenedentota bacterium]